MNGDRLAQVIREFIRPFNPAWAPLLRADANKFMLLLDTNHIIMDDTSIGILLCRFLDLYQGVARATSPV